jgi:hypothetical protein
MRTPILTAAALATAAASALPASAPASVWSPTQTFVVGKQHDAVPRVAVGADGTSALAFRSKTGKLMLSIGRPSGRFSAPRVIDRAGVRDWSVAARAGGRFIVVWEDTDGIRAAVRTGARGPIVVRRVATSNGEEINGVEVAADPRGGWVVAERQFRRTKDRLYYVRAMTLAASGRLEGAIQDLGPGDFGIDARPTMALAVSDIGRAVLAFNREAPSSSLTARPTVAVSKRSHGGTFSLPADLPGDVAGDPRVAVEGGKAVVAATQVRSRGDAGIFGNPVLAFIRADGAPASPFGPAIATPGRAFGPSVAMTPGGRGVLVFQQKPSSQPFETRAPVKAVAFSLAGSVGPVQTLTTRPAKEPVVMALAERGTLTMWSGERGLGAALATAAGRFTKIATPKGPPPPPFHFNSTNRDLRTGGRWAIFAWSREADGRVRVSVRKF